MAATIKPYFDTKRRRIISTRQNPSGRFLKLTTKQKTFLSKNPEASYFEVMNCAISVAPEINLDQYKAEKIAMLSQMSLSRSEELIPSYRVRNLISGVYSEFTTPTASSVRLEIQRVDTALRNEFYRLKSAVEAAETVQGVDEIVGANKFGEIE